MDILGCRKLGRSQARASAERIFTDRLGNRESDRGQLRALLESVIADILRSRKLDRSQARAFGERTSNRLGGRESDRGQLLAIFGRRCNGYSWLQEARPMPASSIWKTHNYRRSRQQGELIAVSFSQNLEGAPVDLFDCMKVDRSQAQTSAKHTSIDRLGSRESDRGQLRAPFGRRSR